MPSLNRWVTIDEEAHNKLFFWKDIPCLRLESDIWPCINELYIKVATDASDFAWGGHNLSGTSHIAHEYLSEWEAIQSSTFRDLLRIIQCLQSLIEICKNKLAVVQVNAMNLLGIVNRGSPKLAFNSLAREYFWLFLSHEITILVKWVPREIHAFADGIFKWLIPNNYYISRPYYNMLYCKWAPHTCDLFSTNQNNHIVLNSSLYIGAEKTLGLMALVLIGVLKIVGSMPRSALSERF